MKWHYVIIDLYSVYVGLTVIVIQVKKLYKKIVKLIFLEWKEYSGVIVYNHFMSSGM
jgi:hypothetical protein